MMDVSVEQCAHRYARVRELGGPAGRPPLSSALTHTCRY